MAVAGTIGFVRCLKCAVKLFWGVILIIEICLQCSHFEIIIILMGFVIIDDCT